MLYRAVRWVALVALAWVVSQTLPSLARYLKIRSM